MHATNKLNTRIKKSQSRRKLQKTQPNTFDQARSYRKFEKWFTQKIRKHVKRILKK